MILDFLQLGEEGEEFYTDFLRMPLDKLKQAGKSFLFPAKDEKSCSSRIRAFWAGARKALRLPIARCTGKLRCKSPVRSVFSDPDFRREEN